MKKLTTILTTLALFILPSCAEEKATDEKVATVKNATVLIKTNLGDLTAELNGEKAPITVKNFLSYVDEKFYDNTVFHRVIQDFMVQGGGFEIKDGTPTQKKTKDEIENESANGLTNDRGTLAMARRNDPNSASSQFFINTVDNASLNHGGPYGGYAVFGKITKGLDTLDKIAAVQTNQALIKSLLPTGQHTSSPAQNVPTQPVTILSITRVKE